MKWNFFIAVFFGLCFLQTGLLQAQVYQSYKSETSFYSEAPLENIAASNDGGASVLNLTTGKLVFLIPIKGFEFRKSLMQEHFNENYMESGKFPNATFSGQLIGFDPSKEGRQAVQAKGKLKIHGVEQPFSALGTIEKNGEELQLGSSFEVALKDHDIKIPRLVVRNIAEVVSVKLSFSYRPRAASQ